MYDLYVKYVACQMVATLSHLSPPHNFSFPCRLMLMICCQRVGHNLLLLNHFVLAPLLSSLWVEANSLLALLPVL